MTCQKESLLLDDTGILERKKYWNTGVVETEEILSSCFSTLHIIHGSSKDQE